MLRTLREEWKGRWYEYIQRLYMHTIVQAVEPVGYNIVFLLFGWSPRLPIDMILGTSIESVKGSHSTYVTKWKSAMSEAYTPAAKKERSLALKGKSLQDHKPHFRTLKPGDLGVLGGPDSLSGGKKRREPCLWVKARGRQWHEACPSPKPATTMWLSPCK